MCTEKPPFIICSAIYFDDGEEHAHQPDNIKIGFVICGRRHCNCFATLTACHDKKHFEFEKEQGFLTNNNIFVNRTQAYYIAIHNGQLKTSKGSSELTSEDLYSEDLY